MANWVRYPLPPFLSVSPLGEHSRSGGAIPPAPPKGYLSDTCAIPYENKANACDTPLCDTISKGYCAIWGGISHWAAKLLSKTSVLGASCSEREELPNCDNLLNPRLPGLLSFPDYFWELKRTGISRNCVSNSQSLQDSLGKKEYTPPPWHFSFLGLSPDPEDTEQKKTMVYTIFLGKQGKRVYTTGPERRVYTIEPQNRKKKKGRVSTVVVYAFFFPDMFFFVSHAFWSRVFR